MNCEQKELLKMVKTAAESRVSAKKSEEETKIILDKITVEVKVKENYEGEDFPKSYSYSSTIKCPLCTHVTKLKKCTTDDGYSRWVISNFNRHLQEHLSKDRAKDQSMFKNSQQQPQDTAKISFKEKLKCFRNEKSSNVDLIEESSETLIPAPENLYQENSGSENILTQPNECLPTNESTSRPTSPCLLTLSSENSSIKDGKLDEIQGES